MDAESIYNTLKTIITNENLVEESFVPKEGDDIYKPFVFMENCLGIPFPIVPKILQFLKRKFFEIRKYKELNFKEIDYCSQCILLINVENVTIWNERKKLIQLGYIKPDYDLTFTKLCLTKHPKSSNIWYHRQWILKHYSQLINFESEFEVIDKAINRYTTNYFAWNHRLWLLDYMDNKKLVEELKNMQSKMYKYISDHAGWNYVLNILKKIVITSSSNNNNNKSELQQLCNEHIEFVKKQLKEFPGHEAIWYYLRLLSAFICQNKDTIFDNGEQDFQTFYKNEITFINDQYLNENNLNTLLVEEKFSLQYKLWLYNLNNKNITNEDYTSLLTEIESYRMMSGDKAINYLIDIINKNQSKQ